MTEQLKQADDMWHQLDALMDKGILKQTEDGTIYSIGNAKERAAAAKERLDTKKKLREQQQQSAPNEPANDGNQDMVDWKRWY